jgi:hypothetical protein
LHSVLYGPIPSNHCRNCMFAVRKWLLLRNRGPRYRNGLLRGGPILGVRTISSFFEEVRVVCFSMFHTSENVHIFFTSSLLYCNSPPQSQSHLPEPFSLAFYCVFAATVKHCAHHVKRENTSRASVAKLV